jgi:hypothetical protein
MNQCCGCIKRRVVEPSALAWRWPVAEAECWPQLLDTGLVEADGQGRPGEGVGRPGVAAMGKQWIEEVKLTRKAAELALRRPDKSRLTVDEIKDLVGQLKGIVAILQNADPADRRAVYRELTLAVLYHDDGSMQVTAGPGACTNECVGGGT